MQNKPKRKKTLKLKCYFSPMKIAKAKVEKGFSSVELALHAARCKRFNTEFKYFEVYRGKKLKARLNTLDYNFQWSH